MLAKFSTMVNNKTLKIFYSATYSYLTIITVLETNKYHFVIGRRVIYPLIFSLNKKLAAKTFNRLVRLNLKDMRNLNLGL